MKNLRLAIKLALGFGILILIAGVLGSLAVWSMQSIAKECLKLSEEYVPAVDVSNAIERSLLETRFYIRSFALSREKQSLSKGRVTLEKAKEHLQVAKALSARFSGLVKLRDGIDRAHSNINEYQQFINETESMNQAIDLLRETLDQAAAEYMRYSYDFLSSQNKQMSEEIRARSGPARLAEQVRKINLINDIINLGNDICLSNFKAQALRSPQLIEKAFSQFDIIESKSSELRALTRLQDNIKQIAGIKDAANKYKTAMDNLLANWRALQELDMERYEVADDLLEISNMEQVVRVADNATSRVSAASRIMVTGLIAAVVFGIVITLYLTGAITRPVQKGIEFARQMSAGDFSQALDIEQKDEVGILARALNTMGENLRQRIREISEGANNLASSSSEILATTTQLASSTTEIVTSVSETTSTMEELKQTVHVSSQKAKNVSGDAQKATQTSQSGMKTIADLIEGINRISEQIEFIAASTVELSEQGQAIGEIIATVNDFAEQSNLLAVNASIEAARAGEQGKGFGVVAQEIRSLAEQSKQATARIRGILNDTQKAIGEVVMITERGSKAAEAGVQQSAKASEVVQMLTDTIAQAADAAVQIESSSQQQLVGVSQVAEAMVDVERAIKETESGVKQLEVEARNLHELGQNLKQFVEQYKI